MAEEEKSKDEKEEKQGSEKAPKEGKETKEDKEGKEEKKKGKGPIRPLKKDLNVGPDFKYIVRIANTDLDGTRPVVFALTGIKGVGVRIAESAVTALNLPAKEMLGNLSEQQIEELENNIMDLSKVLPPWMLNRQREWDSGTSSHILSTDIELKLREDINMMKMIRCYKGIRHEQGQKVRGQRTKSNGRTGLTVGVTKKAILAKAAAERAEKEKGKEGEKK